MSTPFICRQCIARLTKSHSRRFKSKRFQLHTQATSTSAPLPHPWTPSEEQRGGYPTDHGVTNNGELQLSAPPPGQVSQTPRDEPTVERRGKWNGLKKFIPKWRSDVGKAVHTPPVTDSRELKKKIFRAQGEYGIVHKDLIYVYGLSNEEARHAVTQLERLLWGRHSSAEVGARLDLFHDWKKHFAGTLESIRNSHHATLADADPARTDLWAHPTKQDSEAVKDVWQRLGQERREYLWPQVIRSALHSNLSMLPVIFQATFQPSWCPSYVVEDMVYFLLRSLDDIPTTSNQHQQVVELVFFLLKNCPSRYLNLEQGAIRKVESSISTSRLVEFYEALKRIEHPLSPSTLLHFASRFAKKSKYKVQSVDIIHSLSNIPRFDINSPAASSVCTTLLTLERGGELPDDHAAPDELFKLLLDAGFRPNLLNLSALMQNFCIRGRVEVAWNIFDHLVRRGIEPDAHVFSILLNGSKQTLDEESLQRNVDMIEVSKSWSPYLVNDLLDFVYQYTESQRVRRRRQQKRNSAVAWRLMLRIYAKFFKLAPLQKLIRVRLEKLLVPQPTEPQAAHLIRLGRLSAALSPRPDALLMKPDSVTLTLMLRAYLRTKNNPRPIQEHFKLFLRRLRNRNPIAVQLVMNQRTSIFNIFLRDLMQFRQTIQPGLQLVHDMHIYARREMKRLGKIVLCPPPSVHTYTVLMSGLRNHKHLHGAIAALDAMIKEGITPNIVSWNIVLNVLIQEDHLEDAVRVLRHLELIGLQTNERTTYEVTRLSRARKIRILALMKKPSRKPVSSDSQAFVQSLLEIWEKKDEQSEPELPMKEVRKILRQDAEMGTQEQLEFDETLPP